MSTNYRLPLELAQNTSYEWITEDADYSSSSWKLETTLFSSKSTLTVDGVASGTGWVTRITRAQTLALYTGLYGWQTFVISDDDTERYLIDSGTLEVLPDATQTTIPPLDARSTSRKMYDDLSALMTNAQFVKTMDPQQIEALATVLNNLKWDVKRENDAEKLKAGGYPSRKILTRFTR